MYRLLDLISESGSKLKFRKDLTSDDKKTMKFNPEHIPKPIVSDQRSCKSHLPLCLRVVYEVNFVKLLVRQLMLFYQPSQAHTKYVGSQSCGVVLIPNQLRNGCGGLG